MPLFLPSAETAYTLGLFPKFGAKVNQPDAEEKEFNAYYVFDIGETNYLHMFARSDIKKGEEITTIYSAFDDSFLEKAVTLKKYRIFKDENVEAESEIVLSFSFQGAEVDVEIFDSVEENVEDYDVQLDAEADGSRSIRVCLRKNSKDIQIDAFKNENFVRNFLTRLGAKEFLPEIPEFYFANLDYSMKEIINAVGDDSYANDKLIKMVEEYMRNYLKNPQMKNLHYPFYYFKKYEMFAFLSPRFDKATEDTIVRDFLQSWTSDILDNLSPVFEKSGEFGKIASRLLQNARNSGHRTTL